MIDIEFNKKEEYYTVKFVGTKTDFSRFINLMFKIERGERRFSDGKHYLTEKGYLRFYYLFADFVPNLTLRKPETLKRIVTPEEQKVYDTVCENFKLTPYPFQKEAIYEGKKSPEMLYVLPCGAGKTIIGLGIFHELRTTGKISGPGLIVTKASLKEQWAREVEKFTEYSSRVLQTPAMLKDDTDVFNAQFEGIDLLVTNYEGVVNPDIRATLHKKGIEMLFLDEIHYIKSVTAKRTKAIQEFKGAPYKYGATASPVKKNPQDIYSIYSFLQPELFPSRTKFDNKFVELNRYYKAIGGKNLRQLNQELDPYMFIKTSEEVNKFLPQELIIPRHYELHAKQKKMHEKIMDKLDELKAEETVIRQRLAERGINNDKHPDLLKIEAMVMAHQSFAQQLCNDEELLINSSSDMAKQFLTGSSSNKVKLMLDLVTEILESEENVVIFSKFASIQPILRRHIEELFQSKGRPPEWKKYKIAHIKGGMNSKKRYEEVYEKFRDQEEYKVLLASDAGAEGLNLSNCKYLIDFEPADSHATKTQRYGRITRADSTHRNVIVYQLIGLGTWDEIQLKIIEKKEKYHSEIIAGA